jgi:hypothetical protein
MSDRVYRSLLGLALLVGLYFELPELIYSLIAMLFFEGLTNLRLPKLVCHFRSCVNMQNVIAEYQVDQINPNFRFAMESEQAWRLLVGLLLLVTYQYYDQLWFFPWFMGFAIFGAGLSGLCPVLLAIRWIGFR